MNFDSLMGKSAKVWFCLTCDDQAPWRAEEVVKCQTCQETSSVRAAMRFQNLTTEKDVTVRSSGQSAQEAADIIKDTGA